MSSAGSGDSERVAHGPYSVDVGTQHVFCVSAIRRVVVRINQRALKIHERNTDPVLREQLRRFVNFADLLLADVDRLATYSRRHVMSYDVSSLFTLPHAADDAVLSEMASNAAHLFYIQARDQLLENADRPLDFKGMVAVAQALAQLADGLDVLAMAIAPE